MNRYWFGKKRFGWGIGPRSWEGWLTLLVWVVLMRATVAVIDPVAHRRLVYVAYAVLGMGLVAVTAWKYEPSRGSQPPGPSLK